MPYRIGASTPLSDDDNAAVLFGYDPRSTYNPGAERLVTLAGTTVDVGYPRAVWTFAALTVEQWEDLLELVGGYSGEVYVETRNDIDEFDEYRTIARLPEPRDLERWGGYYQNITVELLLVEAVA
jgi:hypothetical protein